jgi:hypothetical protein
MVTKFFKKTIITLLLLSYIGLSQFVVKAYITTDQPSNQDFCITKSLEKHENSYECWKDKNNILSIVQLDLLTTKTILPAFFGATPYIDEYFMIKQEIVHNKHAPPDIVAQTNYIKNFLI